MLFLSPIWLFCMLLLLQILERLVQIQERLVQIRGALVQIRPGYHHTRWRGVWCDTSVASPTLTDRGRVHRWRRPPPLRSPCGRGRGRRGGVAHLDAACWTRAGARRATASTRRARRARGDWWILDTVTVVTVVVEDVVVEDVVDVEDVEDAR